MRNRGRRAPNNVTQLRGWKRAKAKPRWKRRLRHLPWIIGGLIIGGFAGFGLVSGLPSASSAEAADIVCSSAEVTDGDTIRCGQNRIRLEGIDAPEMPGHCRPGRQCTPGDPYASLANLEQLIGGSKVLCTQTDTDRHGRIVARCTAKGEDLSCAQVRDGHAVKRYGWISC